MDETDLVQEQCLTRLIPQAVFDDIKATSIVDGTSEDFVILQRDCVENLVRNFLNMAFLFPNGELRPGVEEKLSMTHDKLRTYYTAHTPEERISNDPEMGRRWLETTIGFEEFGVKYAQANREITSGIDIILALMEGFIPYLRNGGAIPGKDPNQYRAYKLNKMCKWLSTETIKIGFNPKNISNNHEDAKITFKLIGDKNQKETVTLIIGKRHVCIRHRDQLSA